MINQNGCCHLAHYDVSFVWNCLSYCQRDVQASDVMCFPTDWRAMRQNEAKWCLLCKTKRKDREKSFLVGKNVFIYCTVVAVLEPVWTHLLISKWYFSKCFAQTRLFIQQRTWNFNNLKSFLRTSHNAGTWNLFMWLMYTGKALS